MNSQLYNKFNENQVEKQEMNDKNILGDMRNLLNIAAAAAVATGDT